MQYATWTPGYTTIPANPENGGRFTGKPCQQSWANVPIAPTEASFNKILRQHNANMGVPSEVEYHLSSGRRPGNNNLDDTYRNNLTLEPTNQMFIKTPSR